VGAGPFSVALADLNGDGRPDIVAANQSSNSVSVLLNATAPGATPPTFSPRTDLTVASSPFSVALADLNGDGRPDIVAANQSSNNVSVLLNATAPGAATPSSSATLDLAVGAGPFSVALADLNGDGRPDIVTANQSSNVVSVLLNTTAPGASPPS